MPKSNSLSYKFGFKEKLHLQKDYKQILRSGRRLAHPAILIYMYKRQDGLKARRLGLITSRKVGIAVSRNRVKRRLREIFRLNKHIMEPGIDLIFVLTPNAVKLSYKELETAVLGLLAKAGALI